MISLRMDFVWDGQYTFKVHIKYTFVVMYLYFYIYIVMRCNMNIVVHVFIYQCFYSAISHIASELYNNRHAYIYIWLIMYIKQHLLSSDTSTRNYIIYIHICKNAILMN